MAEPPEPIDDGVPAADGPVEDALPAPKRSGRFGLVLAVVVVVAITAGGILSYALYFDLSNSVATALTKVGLGPADANTPRTYGQFSELEGVIINPASTNGQRYLMLNIGLEAPSLATLEEVKEKEVVVRDTVLKVLGSKSVEELSDITLRNQLKESLRGAVNSVLRSGEVDHLYFTRYVLQ